MGIAEQTFYRWKQRFVGMGVAEVRRLEVLEEENRKLKQLVDDLSLDDQILRGSGRRGGRPQARGVGVKVGGTQDFAKALPRMPSVWRQRCSRGFEYEVKRLLSMLAIEGDFTSPAGDLAIALSSRGRRRGVLPTSAPKQCETALLRLAPVSQAKRTTENGNGYDIVAAQILNPDSSLHGCVICKTLD